MSMESYRKGREDAFAAMDEILREVGGCDAGEDWAKGWDAAVDEIDRKMGVERKINRHWLYGNHDTLMQLNEQVKK